MPAPPPQSAGQRIEDFLAAHWVVIAIIVCIIIVAILIVTAPIWLPALAGLVAGAGALLAGAAAPALIVLVLRKLLDGSSGPVTATTSALLASRGTAAWGDVVTFIGSLPGVSPDTLNSLDLGTPPTAGT